MVVFHLVLCNQFPHAIDVDVQVWPMLMQPHDDVLGSAVCKGRNEGRTTACDHLVNA